MQGFSNAREITAFTTTLFGKIIDHNKNVFDLILQNRSNHFLHTGMMRFYSALILNTFTLNNIK